MSNIYANPVGNIKKDIYIIKNDRLINAKSIIGLLSGELSKGDKITIDTSENDENEINKLK